MNVKMSFLSVYKVYLAANSNQFSRSVIDKVTKLTVCSHIVESESNTGVR